MYPPQGLGAGYWTRHCHLTSNIEDCYLHDHFEDNTVNIEDYTHVMLKISFERKDSLKCTLFMFNNEKKTQFYLQCQFVLFSSTVF